MTTIITVPDILASELEQHAQAQQRSVEDVALDILRDALIKKASPSVDAVVAAIKATNPNPNNIRPAQGSLAEALRRTTSNEAFDLDQWQRDWVAVEAEMQATTRTDDRAEGHLRRSADDVPMELLPDDVILELRDQVLPSAMQDQLSGPAQREGTLLPDQHLQLEALLTTYRQGMLRKAQALKVAVECGLQPVLDKIQQ